MVIPKLFVGVICVLVDIPVFAQESSRLSGVVLDWQGATVVKARVMVIGGNRKFVAYTVRIDKIDAPASEMLPTHKIR